MDTPPAKQGIVKQHFHIHIAQIGIGNCYINFGSELMPPFEFEEGFVQGMWTWPMSRILSLLPTHISEGV